MITPELYLCELCVFVRLGEHLCRYILRKQVEPDALKIPAKLSFALLNRDYPAIGREFDSYYQSTGNPVLKIWAAWFHSDMSCLINPVELPDHKMLTLLTEDLSAEDYVASLARRAILSRADNTLLLGWLHSPVFDMPVDHGACPEPLKGEIQTIIGDLPEEEHRSVEVVAMLVFCESNFSRDVKTSYPDLNNPVQQAQVLELAKSGSASAYDYLCGNPHSLMLPALNYLYPPSNEANVRHQALLNLMNKDHNPYAKFMLLRDPAVTVEIIEECFGIEIEARHREIVLEAAQTSPAIKLYWKKYCKQLTDKEFYSLFGECHQSVMFNTADDVYICFRLIKMYRKQLEITLSAEQVEEINEHFKRCLRNQNGSAIAALLMSEKVEQSMYLQSKLLFILMQNKDKNDSVLQALMEYYSSLSPPHALDAVKEFLDWYAGHGMSNEDRLSVLHMMRRMPAPTSEVEVCRAKSVIERLLSAFQHSAEAYLEVTSVYIAWYNCKAIEQPALSYYQRAAAVGDVGALYGIFPDAINNVSRLCELVEEGYISAIVAIMDLCEHGDATQAEVASDAVLRLNAAGHLNDAFKCLYQKYRREVCQDGVGPLPSSFESTHDASNYDVSWAERLKFHLLNCGADPRLFGLSDGLFSSRVIGVRLRVARHLVAQHLHAYALRQRQADPSTMWVKIDRQFGASVDPCDDRSSFSALSALFDRYRRGDPVALSFVWYDAKARSSHTVKHVFFRITGRYYLAVCNRGLGVKPGESGIRVYHVHNPDRIDDRSIKEQLVCDLANGEFINDFDPAGKGLGRVLGLHYVGAVPQSMQWRNNCTLISAYSEIFMYMLIDILSAGNEQSSESGLTQRDIQLAASMTKEFGFKEFRQAGRVRSSHIIMHMIHGLYKIPIEPKYVRGFLGNILNAMTAKVSRCPADIRRCTDILRPLVRCIQDFLSQSPIWSMVCLNCLQQSFGLVSNESSPAAVVTVEKGGADRDEEHGGGGLSAGR